MDLSTFSRWAHRFVESYVSVSDQDFQKNKLRNDVSNLWSDKNIDNVRIPHFEKFEEEKKLCMMVSSLLDCWIETKLPSLCDLTETQIWRWRSSFLASNMLNYIPYIAIDETGVRVFEHEVKSRPNEWRAPFSTRPKNFHRAVSKVKKTIFAYSHQDVNIIEFSIGTGLYYGVTGLHYGAFLQSNKLL